MPRYAKPPKDAESKVTSKVPRQPVKQPGKKKSPPKSVRYSTDKRTKRRVLRRPSAIADAIDRQTDVRVDAIRALADRAEEAAATGMLPHEWLLAIMRGTQLNHYAYDSETQEIVEIIVLPTFNDRIECAKAAAPYYAEKLSNAGGLGAGKPKQGKNFDPSKPMGVMKVPLAESMKQWTDVSAASQAKLKKDVTK